MRPSMSRDDLRSAWLISIACAAVSMVVAAMAALNTALPDIAIDVGADAGQMTWIVDGYTLALAALLLPAGAVGDRFGRRGVLIAGLVFFGIASLLAIWVSSPTELIATRCLAGAAAALIMPTTLSLITSGVPESRRAMAVSIWAAVAGGGAIAGFLVTGILLEFFSWHSIFITFAASSVISAALCFTIGTSRDRNPGAFDYLGTVSSVLAVTAIVFGLLEAPHRGWDDPVVLVCLVGGIALVGVFCIIELRRESPLLDIRLFANRAFGAGSLSVAIQFLGSFGMFYLLLQQLQLVFGYSALKSALALLPFVVGVGIFSLVGNWAAVRFHMVKYFIGGGVLLSGVGIILMGAIDYDDYLSVAWILGIFASGIGLANATSTTAIMSNTPLDNQGIGSAVNDTSREVGAAIGIALAGSIVAAGWSSRIGPVADETRAQMVEAGQQRIAAGDAAGGQALVTQADAVADTIRRSLAEASAVADRLADQAGPLAARILDGAREAFMGPLSQAYIVLGSVIVASSLVLFWLAPMRIVAESPEATDDSGLADADDAAPEDAGAVDTRPGG
ncbi:MFS transporter [Gordonia hankookensis]|uniref:MFS transporter n=2 Tax=Gordonia hankookensis TaxID=589403 RepID=A0ABR7WA06_9ACTN|nr:MFS transporter [Gordonia hankookensis]MBD1319646.1 MFS transporter [Gordonia hankookensis]